MWYHITSPSIQCLSFWLGSALDDIFTGGSWKYDEALHHMNCLEMYAIHRNLILSTFAVDVFTLDPSWLFSAFPQFSVIPAVLSKIVAEKDTGVCILPDRPTQGRHPKATQILRKERVILKARKDLLRLPSHPGAIHPLCH